KIRKLFREDEEAAMEQGGLTDEEKRLVRTRDWIGMIHYGVIFFMLEKLGAVTGIGNIDIYAAMKGMSVPEFQKTRNAQINYGVAGKEDRPAEAGAGRAGMPASRHRPCCPELWPEQIPSGVAARLLLAMVALPVR